MDLNEDVIQDLVQGIVILAVQDYIKARKKLKKCPNDSEAQHLLWDVENFFRSQWFVTLTGFDGNIILGRLEEQVNVRMKQAKTQRVNNCDIV